MKHRSIILLSVLALSVIYAEESTDPIFDRIVKVERFSFGGVGYAGVISQGEQDYNELLSRPSALKDFQKLFKVGNVQAKCYALVGIRKLDAKKYKTLASSLESDGTKVTTQRGCIIGHEPMNKILRDIEAGHYDATPKRKNT